MSDASEVINLLFFFFSFSLGFFWNLQILVFLTIILARMFGLLLKNDMMEFISGNVAGFWIFSGFSRIFPDFSGSFRISLKSSDFSSFNHISWQNVFFTFQKWYDEIYFWKSFRFWDFFRIFPDFLKIFWFQWFIKSFFLTEYLVYVFEIFSGFFFIGG